jgi:antitoxin ParD1/3/4
MPQRNVNLTEHFDQFIDAAVESGRFSNASEIVREGLRLLEQREREDQAKIEWMRSAAKESFGAIERGDSISLGSDAEIASFLQGARKKALARAS